MKKRLIVADKATNIKSALKDLSHEEIISVASTVDSEATVDIYPMEELESYIEKRCNGDMMRAFNLGAFSKINSSDDWFEVDGYKNLESFSDGTFNNRIDFDMLTDDVLSHGEDSNLPSEINNLLESTIDEEDA